MIPDPKAVYIRGMDTRYQHDPAYTSLGDGFADEATPADFPSTILRFRNDRHADAIGLGGLDSAAWTRHFARFEPLPANLSRPLALRYHGHQFMSYNPGLGDGRGFLFAQLRAPDGRLLDLGTKGSGTTPWSRGGDGRLTLKGGVRELLATELLEALGVTTSKSFSLVETGEELDRYDEPSPTRASVLVRLSHGHIRFGSFQRFAFIGDLVRLRKLFDYSCSVYHPQHATPAGFLARVSSAVATTCGRWIAAGFVHGVLNTDNMNITGESFDYGPWRFTPECDPGFTAAYFDHGGLYAYGNQAKAVRWNVQRLADALSGLGEPLDHALDSFEEDFFGGVRAGVLQRLGVAPVGDAADTALIQELLRFAQKTKINLDRLYFDLYGGAASHTRRARSPFAPLYRSSAFELLAELIDGRAARHPERLADPYWQEEAPVDLHIDTVEALWAHIDQRDDWAPLNGHIARIRKLGALLAE